MKTKIFLLTSILVFFLIRCDKEETNTDKNITAASISFTGCNTGNKSTGSETPALRLIGIAGDKLLVKLSNTEFCCGTNSVSIISNVIDNEISIEIIDQGPFTWCYCLHDMEFSIGPLNREDYILSLVESEHSYSRDTFLVSFNYSQQLDTTIISETISNLISNKPLNWSKTLLGGCNNMFKSAAIDNVSENDTLIFHEQGDTLRIFVGVNATCCIDYGSGSSIQGDTLVMRIYTLNDDFCDCMCYYTFDFYYSDYAGQGFYYQFFVDDYQRFEGKYNLP